MHLKCSLWWREIHFTVLDESRLLLIWINYKWACHCVWRLTRLFFHISPENVNYFSQINQSFRCVYLVCSRNITGNDLSKELKLFWWHVNGRVTCQCGSLMILSVHRIRKELTESAHYLLKYYTTRFQKHKVCAKSRGRVQIGWWWSILCVACDLFEQRVLKNL